MKYIINKDRAKEFIIQMDNKLNLIDVRGDSVGNLYVARMMLKELFDSVEEVEEEKNKEG